MAYSEVTKKNKLVFDSKHLTVKKSHIAPGIKDFDILKPISRGAFGQVYLARKKGSHKLYALKSMKKTDVLNKNMMDQVVAERDALAISSKSPFVVQLFYSFQSDEKIFLVMEYMIGGDIKSLLHNLGYFTEDMARFYIAEGVLALEYLHSHSIYHRDIKPDNMLLSNSGHMKLTDFGLSYLTSERKPNFLDLINTPRGPSKENSPRKGTIFWRTPGQLQSLTSKFTFSLPRAKHKRIRRQSSARELNTACLVAESTNFIFSPPQPARNDITTPKFSKISTTPGAAKTIDYCNSANLTSGHTGLTTDITILTLGTCRKRSYTDFEDQDDQDKNQVEEKKYKRVRVYSQSLPNELETSREVLKSCDNMKTNLVRFADTVQNINDSYIESPQIVLPVNETFQTTDTSPNELSSTANISGITALTETSQMSISATDSLMLSPHNCDLAAQRNKSGNILKFTPSPLQQYVKSSDKFSPSLTPKTVISRNRQPSDVVITPVQMLKFFDGLSPDIPKANTTTICQTEKETTPRAIPYGTPENNLNSWNNSVSAHPLRTPFRTPKSCFRGKATLAQRRKILGTPDYLAPEILLGKAHDSPVDWWALGICFYEFLTGIPPFNDDTPELVFEHILDHDLIWPEGEESLSNEAVDSIESLLTFNPDERPKAVKIKSMDIFKDVDWKNLPNETAPFVPQPDDAYDTTYFAAKNCANQLQMSVFNP